MSVATAPTTKATDLQGLLAEFDSPGSLVTAAEQVRDAGFTHWDTYTPFPVHGIDEAMDIRRSRLPWIVFGIGFAGCMVGLLMQWWMNAAPPAKFPGVPTFLQGFDFPISGKPIFSLPANIPIIFELTILAAALTTVVGMLAMNNLPRHHNPLFNLPRFRHVTTDRFFLRIDAADPQFDAAETTALLNQLGAATVERVEAATAPRGLPRGVIIAIVVFAALALFPPLIVAKARLSQSTKPRIALVQDMDNQDRYKTQQANPAFSDGRAMRPQVEGTIARGDLHDDPHFYEGKVDSGWALTFPPQLEINKAFVVRGQQRFAIYCAPCHGLGGAGDGMVHQRAVQRDTPGWVQPASLQDALVRSRPAGHIFNTISRGIRSMPPYGDQIPPADRWAIVAYVRALQLSQDARLEEVPPERRDELH
jgi:mono/diheme cytochrome c family protein